MKNYLVRGYSKTGIFSVNVSSDDMEEAFKIGKAQIKTMSLLPIKSWCIDKDQN